MDQTPRIDHYARMKFPMYSTVYFSTITGTVTGWSTNGDMGEATTYCYQLNNGGDLVQETNLSPNPLATTPAAETPAAEAPAAETTPAAETPAASATETPAAETAPAAETTPASAPAAEAPAAETT